MKELQESTIMLEKAQCSRFITPLSSWKVLGFLLNVTSLHKKALSETHSELMAKAGESLRPGGSSGT